METRQLGKFDGLMAAFEAIKGWVDLVIKVTAISMDYHFFRMWMLPT